MTTKEVGCLRPDVGRMRTESEKINIPQDIIDNIKGHLVEPKKAKI